MAPVNVSGDDVIITVVVNVVAIIHNLIDIQTFSSKIVQSAYLTCSLEALQIKENEFVIIDLAEEGITFSVSSIYNTQATVFWNSNIFESYDYNNTVSGRIRLKVHLDSLVSVLKTFNITLIHESSSAHWSISYDVVDGSLMIKTNFFGGARKESRLTTTLIDDENNEFNLLNDQYVNQNTLYEIKIKSTYLKSCLLNIGVMKTFSVEIKCEASRSNDCDSDNENRHFLLFSAIDVYGRKECKIPIACPLNHQGLTPSFREINAEIIIKENGMMLIKIPINKNLNIEYIYSLLKF
ncbi:9145_t:CDS:10 [Entrophospora sp. SA101]|nr:9145_t:CDS:10 [Entrophospora sp. SA101]